MPAKTYEETLLIKQRYADLTEPVFKVLKEALAGDNNADKKWAVEQVSKAFVKMIPQDVTSGGEKVGGVNLFDYVQYLEDKNNNSNKEDKKVEEEN